MVQITVTRSCEIGGTYWQASQWFCRLKFKGSKEDDAERRRLKGRREITHGLVKDYVWLSLFTSPAMGARGLSITEGEKDMDLLINDKLHVDFSHEGECDPVHLTCRPCGRGRAL